MEPLMNTDDLIVHPPSEAALELVLLFHGVGASPEGLVPLGQALARPDRWVVSVRSPFPSDMGGGWQWFSVRGIDEANRVERIAAVMPRFVQTVQAWQARTGLDATATALAGFSQGAIMALESMQQAVPLASRVVSMAGRFAEPPRVAPAGVSLHFIHGAQDMVIPAAHSVSVAERLRALGASPTVDVLPGLGHGIDERVLALLTRALDPA